MIQLLSDKVGNIGEFEKRNDGFRYRFKVRLGDRYLCSPWHLLSSPNAEIQSTASRYFEVAESWFSYRDSSVGRDYWKARKAAGEGGSISFKAYPLHKADQLEHPPNL